MLTDVNIEAELSYAYLHAVASSEGFGCTVGDRHLDNAGIDAIVREDGRMLAADSTLTSFELHVQLKATYVEPTLIDGKYSYSLTVPRYDRLRTPNVGNQRLLVVLYLPRDRTQWLSHTEDGLIAKRCAYWVSLRNAPDSPNDKHQTVYVPITQALSPYSLKELMTRISRGEEINYET